MGLVEFIKNIFYKIMIFSKIQMKRKIHISFSKSFWKVLSNHIEIKKTVHCKIYLQTSAAKIKKKI